MKQIYKNIVMGLILISFVFSPTAFAKPQTVNIKSVSKTSSHINMLKLIKKNKKSLKVSKFVETAKPMLKKRAYRDIRKMALPYWDKKFDKFKLGKNYVKFKFKGTVFSARYVDRGSVAFIVNNQPFLWKDFLIYSRAKARLTEILTNKKPQKVSVIESLLNDLFPSAYGGEAAKLCEGNSRAELRDDICYCTKGPNRGNNIRTPIGGGDGTARICPTCNTGEIDGQNPDEPACVAEDSVNGCKVGVECGACPVSGQIVDSERDCVCPDGGSVDSNTNACITAVANPKCVNEEKKNIDDNCVSCLSEEGCPQCTSLYVLNKTAKSCVLRTCVEGQTRNDTQHCKCLNGEELNKAKDKCIPVCPESEKRSTKDDTCEKKFNFLPLLIVGGIIALFLILKGSRKKRKTSSQTTNPPPSTDWDANLEGSCPTPGARGITESDTPTHCTTCDSSSCGSTTSGAGIR